MAEVTLTINGRSYAVSCENGQEARLRRLGKYLDAHIGRLAGEVGQVGDLRLMLLAGLIVSDELAEAQDKLAKAEREIARLEKRLGQAADKTKAAELDAAAAVEAAAARVEDAVSRLAGLAR